MKYPKTAPVKVIIIGAGGTGGYVIPHLYRIGFVAERSMRILVCDGDVVEEKNLIRQNFVEQDVGRNKAQVLAERYSAAFGIECEYIPRFVESEEELFQLTVPDFFKSSYRGNTAGNFARMCGQQQIPKAVPCRFRQTKRSHLHRLRQRGAHGTGGMRRPSKRAYNI